MSNSIIDIDNWATSTSYRVHDIVLQGNYHYYCLIAHTSSTFSTDLNNGYWGGRYVQGINNYPVFIWKPSFNYRNENEPNINEIKFGNGYEQVVSDNINNLLINAEYSFNNRSLAETTAILHFLSARGGFEWFYFYSPAPRNRLKKFRCKRWSDSQEFAENYSITANFTETV